MNVLWYLLIGLFLVQFIFQPNSYLLILSILTLAFVIAVHLYDIFRIREAYGKVSEQKEAVLALTRQEQRLKNEIGLLHREAKFHRLLQKLFEDTSGKMLEEVIQAVINILKVAQEGSFVFYFEKDFTGNYSLVDGSVSNVPAATLEAVFQHPSVKSFLEKKSSGVLSGINFKLGKWGMMNSAWVLPLVNSIGDVTGAIFVLYPVSEVSLETMTETWLLERNIALIIELASIHEAERRMAFKDALTGAYNRNFMFTQIQKDIEKAKSRGDGIYLAIFDIDNFKKFNDTYGHDAGDTVLKCVVQETQRKLRPVDFLVRYGGEEFVIIMINSNIDTASERTETVRAAIENTKLTFGGKQVNVTCSFGLTQLPPGKSIEQAITVADKALYKAKAGGKNKVEIGEFEENISGKSKDKKEDDENKEEDKE